jgi:hypothetical protein
LAVGLGLARKTAAPRPEAGSAEQRNQNYTDDGYPYYPTNCQLGNQEKNEQQNYAGDYEDGGKAHYSSV